MSVIDDLKRNLRGTYGTLIRIILINSAVFLLANILVHIVKLNLNSLYADPYREAYMRVSEWTDLPGSLNKLPTHFWTIFSYMFTHYELLHLVFNMLFLYSIGRIFTDLLGGARLFGIYLMGGIAGGIVFILSDNLIFSGNSQLEGASAGVMAVVVAAAFYKPDYTLHLLLFGEVKLKWLALISFILTTLLNFSDNFGGKAAHLGGAILGMLYGLQMRKSTNFMEGFMNLFRPAKHKLRVAHKRSHKVNDDFYNTNRSVLRKRVDEILDKISRSGYDSLSKEEKDFLQNNHNKF
jgi:membrane associated rhomboid family serine protease